MNNVFVYCEIEGTTVADVSLELLTKGRKLANQLGCQLEAIAAGTGLAGIEKQVLPYGVDKLHVFDAPGLFPYTSLPHTSILVNLFKEEKPQICLMGATVIGRDLGPRVSSALTSGLTVPSWKSVPTKTRRTASPMKICCIRFVPPSVVTSLQPLSTPSTAHRWRPFVRE